MRTNLHSIAVFVVMAGTAMLVPPLHPGAWHHEAAHAQGAPQGEKEAFEAAKELGSVEAWDAFLSHYPSGFHADLARAYVKKLAQPGAPTPPAATGAAPAPTASGLVAGPPAQELPCSKAEKLSSDNSDKPAKIRFVNESGATIIIQWIDFKGALKEYATLEPGAELTQDTFLTHPWIAAYQEGSCRQLFLPGDGVTVARLLPEDQLAATRGAMKDDDPGDHGPTPEQACRDSGMDYDDGKCVARKKKSTQPSKATIERRAKAACVDIGMIYLNGKCAPKTKTERNTAAKNKNKACPAGMYRNPNGQCQPNETGG